jgi:hypothetical protein
MNNLYRHNRNIAQWSTGGAYLQFLYEVGPHKLITGVECEFLAIQTKQMALLDTGSELSLVDSTVYQWFFHKQVGLGKPVGTTNIHTRLGTFAGNLYRVEVGLTAHWGESLMVEGTFLFCEQWNGPTVLGLQGFLERIRFAIDPNYERVGCIYFAAAD